MFKLKSSLTSLCFGAAILLLSSSSFAAQLTLSSANATQGNSVQITATYNSQGSQAGTLAFDLQYDSAVFTSLTATAGPSATAAMKTLQVSGADGAKKFLLLNIVDLTTPIGDGVVVNITLQVAPNAPSGVYPLTVLNGQYLDTGGTFHSLPTVNGSVTVGNPAVPVLGITKTHSGTFTRGQSGASYTVTVSNGAAAGPTSGVVTVTEVLPEGLTLGSMSGTGWTCGGVTCSRSDVLAPGNSYPPITVLVNVSATAATPQVNTVNVTGGGSAAASASDSTPILIPPAVLTIAKTHNGNLTQGQTGFPFTIVVSNGAAGGPTAGTVTVTETVPPGLTLASLSGTGWTCPAGGNSCTRADVLNPGGAYPAITATVNVAANATSPQVNAVSVSGGGSQTASASDSATVTNSPVLSISKSHTGNFTPGQTGAGYVMTVSNSASAGPTSGTVTVSDTVPSGLVLVSMSGNGWICPSGTNTCTRSDVLNAGGSYPNISVTVNVAANATTPQVNVAGVSGGGSASASATDPTTITSPPLAITAPATLPAGSVGTAYSQIITASGGSGAYTWSASGLPAGLSIGSASGAISGTPASNSGSPFNITIAVTDAASATASKTYSLVINPQTGVLLIGGNGVGAAGQTVEIPIQLKTSSGPSPSGFALDASFDQQKLTFVSARKGEQLTSSGKDLSTAVQANGDVRLLGVGIDQTLIADGPIAYVTFKLNNQFNSGSTPVSLKNCQALDAQGQPLAVTCTAGTITQFAIRVNAGGPDYTDSATGFLWSADNSFSGGSAISTTQNIANTNTPVLYQTARSGAPVEYRFTNVPAGNYAVRLKFAEISNSAVGQRVFDIAINGATVQSKYDIVADAGGPLTAVDKNYFIAVNSGEIAISMTPSVDSALVNAIEITPAGAPILAIAKTHLGNFMRGQNGASYSLSVSNATNGGPTSGTVTVTEMLPTGLSLVSMSGAGWACASTACTRNDALAPGASYPAITVIVNVAADAVAPLVNKAAVSGGGGASASTTDPTGIAEPSAILLPAGITLAPGEDAVFPVSLASPAPAGGVLLTLASSDTSVLTVRPQNIFIPQGQTQYTLPRITAINIGTATITASAFGLPSTSQAVRVTSNLSMAFSPASLTITGHALQKLTLKLLGGTAPSGGLKVNLSSSNPSVLTVPASVTFAASSDTVSILLNPTSAGTVTLTASASPNLPPTTAEITVREQ